MGRGKKRQAQSAFEDLPELELDAGEVDKLVKSISEKLDEANVVFVEMLIRRMGLEKGQELLDKTLELEKGEGITTADGSRRKSPGGVFLHLAKDEVGKSVFNGLSNRLHKKRKQEKKTAEESKAGGAAEKSGEESESKSAAGEAKGGEEEDEKAE
jgi:phosphorylated adapter RNA export protein